MKNVVYIVGCVAISMLLAVGSARAAVMNDYCVTPSFIQATSKPNLLMMLDNSASMYDLAYVDKGTATRQPMYCYDQTYSSANTYSGYFDSAKFYDYNFTNDYFTEIAAFPVSCTSKYVASTLCIEGANIGTSTTPKTATKFAAKGNYLNWLTVSKFDVEKQILTGGKYNDTSKLFLAESRGCIGRRFVKEALAANYVEGGTNTELAITFGVRGPSDPADPTQPSPGGQTYIDIFDGNYDQAACDQAVDDITAGQLGAAKTSVKTCLAYPAGASQETKEGVVFNQSLQACLALNASTAIATDDVNTVVKQCTDVYAYYGNDPDAIPLTSPAYLCNSTYVGKCYDMSIPGTDRCTSDDSETGLIKTQGGAWDKDILKGSGVICGKACVIDRHEAFCGQVKVPPVTDPTEGIANTTNVPAILSDTGVLAQLDLPLFTGKGSCSVSGAACVSDAGCPASPPQKCVSNGLAVRIYNTAAPTGLVQEFSSLIRAGAMAFNYNGSKTENTLMIPPANTNPSLSIPLVCSGNNSLKCMSDKDCAAAGAGTCSVADATNKDGAQIIHYIGKGTCSGATSTVCATDAHCPAGEQCLSEGVGSHATGLVKAIDDVKAATWTPFAEAFYNTIGYFAKDSSDATGKTSRTADMRLNTADFLEAMNPSQYRCQANNILLITDGMSTADRNSNVNGLAALYNDGDGEITGSSTSVTACPGYMGSKNLDDLAWLAKNRKISVFSKTTASTTAPADMRDLIKTYVVNTGEANYAAGECNPALLMQQTATNGGGTYRVATDPPALKTALRQALVEISAGVSSGTAASILSNSEGSGANILQAVFYPKKNFNSKICSTTIATTCTSDTNCPTGETCKDSAAAWIGEIQNLWYYIDPQINNSTVREDSDYTPTNLANGDPHYLNLKSDKVARFYFDSLTKETKTELLLDTDGNGTGDQSLGSVPVDAVKSIWRAGKLLWAKSAASRTIKTNVGGTLMDFSATNKADTTLQTYLQITGADATGKANNAEKLINYVRGVDYPSDSTFRRRTVGIDGVSSVWKLGDIISSTPRLQSSVRQNGYSLLSPSGYGDKSYGDDNNNKGYVYTPAYKGRGTVYVGANDGMLHAFKLGILDVTPAGDRKAKLSGTDLGEEQWAFIPKNVLPYLKYLAEPNYSHLYVMDGSTNVIDASIGKPGTCLETDYWNCPKDFTSGTGNTWRTVLIGSMGIGGASRNLGDACTDLSTSGSCVETPIDGVGYSSYYALDVTDPANPVLLWEFSDPNNLGFATSGAAIVRVSARKADGVTPDPTKNGRWFAVFGSGPTGPIDPVQHRFLGTSNQPLKVLVVDLATGLLVRTIDTLYDGSTLSNAFAGSMVNATIDTDRWNKASPGFYQDDALYFGYTEKTTDGAPVLAADGYTTNWRSGGVLRLSTGDDLNVANWKLSKVFTGIGPVTAAIARLQDRKNHKLWLYFGPGRFFFSKDDYDSGRNIYGITEPCYNAVNDDLDPACTVSRSFGDVTNQTNADQSVNSAGWRIALEGVDSANVLGGERTITDPVALTNGAVFFTTFKPTGDACGFGGNSYLWAVRYDDGKQAPAKAMDGKALVQVSTGSFEEINLKTAFTGANSKNNRRLATPLTGKPPTDAPPIISKSNLKPVKRIIHIRER